ncbi:hypothetical protein F4678DRAFT_192806 [Xylaria arbuscula]|nr:hypothetical protein F4678DRAFT_192806 [Xylaria arbuscula]
MMESDSLHTDDLATDAKVKEQLGDPEEGELEYLNSESDVDSEGDTEDQITDEVLKDNLRVIEGRLGDKNYVSLLNDNEETQKEFLREFDAYLGSKPPEKVDNVLHFMAGKRVPSPFLIRFMLDNHKDRMDDKDNAQRRPLTLAIESNQEDFIRTVLDSEYDDRALERILGLKSSDAGNGIHKAIRNISSPKLIIDLINKVSNDVLKDTDGEGCTPLHRAVEYTRCTEAQVDVVKALLERGDLALDERNKAGLSVYQHHFSTRPKGDKNTTTLAPHSKLQSESVTTSSHLSNPPHVVGDNMGNKRGTNPNKNAEDEEIPSGSSPAHPPDMVPDPNFRWSGTFKQEHGSKGSVSNISTSSANYQANVSRKTTSTPQPATIVPPARTSKKPSSATSKGPKTVSRRRGVKTVGGKVSKDTPPVSVVFADMIADEVKLQYLRSTFQDNQRNHDSAVEFLYVGHQTKHICFNLLHNYKPLTDKSLKTGSYSRFEFDTALQFVAVGPTATKKIEEPAISETRRSDMIMLFKWLKEKKVKVIIKVIVDDHKSPFHSDEGIINALGQFHIETLDWSKPDLCPETIRTVCKGVRELHLSWSGLNGMLLAWGGTDGLANLPNLTDVYLRQTSNIESEKWTNQKLVEFEKRLKNSRDLLIAKQKSVASKDALADLPRIRVHPPKAQPKGDDQQTVGSTGQEQNKETTIKDHQWLEYMDRFSSEIFTLPPEKYIRLIPDLPAELQRDVRICLIDDGVDIRHRGIMECIEEDGGKAFGAYPGDMYRGMARPFYDSTTNHGTLMANMMVRVCPFVKIASYRLDTRPGEDNRVHFTAKSAADALEYAVKQDFDIISISWTVREETGPNEDNSEYIARIKKALRQAAETKVVFCSAPDTGEMSRDELSSYVPVGSGVQGLFRIGAAKADNTPWPQAGDHNIIDYVLPGHDVREKQGHKVNQNDNSLNSGSSIATALAAGLAALMIHIVRMAVIHTYELRQQTSNEANILKLSSLKTIKSPPAMRKYFDSKAGDKMYVHVWGDFNKKGMELKAANESEDSEVRKWKIIGEMARNLVSSQNTN